VKVGAKARVMGKDAHGEARVYVVGRKVKERV
jgi:hypothetical protein